MFLNAWDEYPVDYRREEIEFLRRALCAGECCALVGLSGSGKSNLLGFLTNRVEFPDGCPRLVMVDCNRLSELKAEQFFDMAAGQLSGPSVNAAWDSPGSALARLESCLESALSRDKLVCLLIDRFDVLVGQEWFAAVSNNLRALRDRFKYRLAYLVAARQPLDQAGELAELFYGRTLWLGPLSKQDALWSAARDLKRFSRGGLVAGEAELQRIVQLSGGYPSMLRAVCEAYAAGSPLEEATLRRSLPVAARLEEFWQDNPGPEALRLSNLSGHPWLGTSPPEMRIATEQYTPGIDSSQLTAKENLLLRYLMANPGRVCEKDELVQAVWPEEVQFSRGVRDESLAQLVRRLRLKIETSPEDPVHILTAPGRGYIYRT